MKGFTLNFLFDELITCGAVLSTFELVEALRKQGVEAEIISNFSNKELEQFFNIKTIKRLNTTGINITCTPKRNGDIAYVRTKDGRWLNHPEPKICVSQWIADWIGGYVIGNGTHKRFKNYKIKRDIDVLIEGNYEPNKNIEETIKKDKEITSKKIVWFGRKVKPWPGVETIESPSLSEIVSLYNRSKIFLKMSKEEGWGRPVAEAMACGCKVINLSGGNQKIENVRWESIAKKLIKYLNENHKTSFWQYYSKGNPKRKSYCC